MPRVRVVATILPLRAHSSAGERPPHTREVAGSIPAAPITKALLAWLVVYLIGDDSAAWQAKWQISRGGRLGVWTNATQFRAVAQIPGRAQVEHVATGSTPSAFGFRIVAMTFHPSPKRASQWSLPMRLEVLVIGREFYLAREAHQLDPLMIVTTLEKETLTEPYTHLSHQFADVLRDSDVLLTLGLSLRDRHILSTLAYRHATLSVVVVAPDSAAIIERLRTSASGWAACASSQARSWAGTGVSFSPVSSPATASPANCCHQVSVWRSYMTRSELRRFPLVPKSSSCPSSVRSKTRAVLQSGQNVTAIGVPPRVSLAISCQIRT